MEKIINNYFSGTSGLILPVPNKSYYPEAFREQSRLCYYGSLMNSIEINSSFYKIPLGSTMKKWSEDVPQDFKFTFKLFKGITHNPGLAYDQEDISRFMNVISHVGSKQGSILVQFPPSVRIANYTHLSRLMASLRDHDPGRQWNIALEFRHQSLYVGEVRELLQELGFGMVMHDKGIAASPFDESDLNFRYLRFHGPDGNYRGSYTEEVLYEYAGYIAEWITLGKQVFVYFNNTMGAAYENQQTLKSFVADLLNDALGD